MAQPKRKFSPWRDIDITDDGRNVIQARRIPRVIKPRRDDYRHTVRAGETITKIAARFLGDPLNFSFIMDRNNIDYPLDLAPGTVIFIPSIVTMDTEARRR